MKDPFAQLVGAANSGAFGLGSRAEPTPAQIRAGNYAKGSLRMQGMSITIETPMFQPRRGKEDGLAWSVTCMAHYGYLNGVVGADGDNLDVYVGPVPESQLVVVINQVKKDAAFDEHKVMLGFHDLETALTAYTNSYEKGWRGLGSYVACSVTQFKAWTKSGDLSRPMEAADLPHDETFRMSDVLVNWGDNHLPADQSLDDVMAALQGADTEGLLLDSVTMGDLEEFLSDGTMLDALVIEYHQFERKAQQLLKVMTSAAQGVKPVSVEVSKAFKNRGTTQVAMLFGMDDGQSVSVFFHNPDSTPNKLAATDELISWKWVLNKQDITITVAPEKGQDLNPRQVGRRIMTLVEKNSAKFLKSAAAGAEKSAEIDTLKEQIESKTGELQSLNAQIVDLQTKIDQQSAEAAAGAAQPEGLTAGENYAQKFLAEADAIGEKIKSLGVEPMTRDEFMAKVNAGETQGHDMAFLKARLAEATTSLAAVKSGNATPRSIIGKGGTKKAAIAWLENSIAETQAAVDSGGILATVNASNYLYHTKAQLRGLEAQQTAGQDNQDFGNGADDAEAEKIARLLEMLAGARARLAAMATGDAYYGNLARDIADMAKQLWDAGYRGPEASESAPQAPEAQPDMLGDDPDLRDNRTDLEKLTQALQAGNAMGALSVLDAIEDVDALRQLVLEAGFSLGASGTKDEILAGVGKDLVRAAKAKVDGFGLRDLDKAAAPAKAAMLPYAEWEAAVAEAISELFEMSYGDASGILELKRAELGQLYSDKKSPEDAARSVMPGVQVEPGTDEERAMLAAHLAERAEEAAQHALGADDDTGTIAPEGRENTVKTAKGTKVVTGFKVIEAKNLVISHESDGTENPDYPRELQPRDRARATSQAWVAKTARSLDPDSLGRTNRADSGAPIVGTDRVVESGNGRAMAIREAYRIGQADEYRAWLIENADYFKVSVAKIEAMKAPVLVRVRTSDVNRAEFAVEANQDDKLAMTATEKARSDAKRLDAAMLAKLADGDLTSAANRDFINSFLQSLGDAEAAQYLTSDGRPTSSLINRIQAALFAGAYSDDRLLELTADVSKPEIANIVSALNAAAPDFMRAKDLDQVAGEQAGERVTDSVELSLNQTAVDSIINATNMLRKAKESGLGIDEFLRQGDMFGDVDPAVAAMAVFISQNNRSAKRLGTAFKAMAQFVETEVKRKQTAGLFGDEPASFTDIVKAANARLEQEYGEGVFAISQDDLFNPPTAQPAQTPQQPEVDDQEDALKQAKDYLDSIIEGSADFSSPDTMMKELERIYGEFGEGALSDLFAQAAEAFSKYALKMTAEAF